LCAWQILSTHALRDGSGSASSAKRAPETDNGLKASQIEIAITGFDSRSRAEANHSLGTTGCKKQQNLPLCRVGIESS
jgi:hypothetical protein